MIISSMSTLFSGSFSSFSVSGFISCSAPNKDNCAESASTFFLAPFLILADMLLLTDTGGSGLGSILFFSCIAFSLRSLAS